MYANPVLPDFMVFLNYKDLPWFWHGFDWFGYAMLMAVLVPGVLAGVFGYLAVSLVGKYLCYAILALAVDLVWGFVGILTLGHAAFFALGGYAMGMYLMRQIGAVRTRCCPTSWCS